MTAEPHAEIARLVEMQMSAWARGDAEGYASTAGDDLGFTNLRGQRWIGRAAFVAVHGRIFGGVYAGSRLDAEIERIVFAGQGVAIVELLLRLTGMKAVPPGIAADADGTLRTRLVEVFEKRPDGVWTLIVCHNTAVAPDVS
jgi:uncharacterized protein (TIGR02246 family)